MECLPMSRVDVALSRMSVVGSKDRMVDAAEDSRVVVVAVIVEDEEDANDLVMNDDVDDDDAGRAIMRVAE